MSGFGASEMPRSYEVCHSCLVKLGSKDPPVIVKITEAEPAAWHFDCRVNGRRRTLMASYEKNLHKFDKLVGKDGASYTPVENKDADPETVIEAQKDDYADIEVRDVHSFDNYKLLD
jgi:hypothetical protein